MIKVIITSRRSNTNTPFFMRPQTINDVLEIQQNEGKFVRESRNLSEDGLTFTYEGIWKTIEDYQEFKTHTCVVDYGNERTAYNLENSISVSTTVLDYMDQ